MTAGKPGVSGRCMWCGQKDDDLCTMKHLPEYDGIVVPTHSPIRACSEHRELVHGYLLEVARRSGTSLALWALVMLAVVVGGVAGKPEIAAAGLLVGGVWVIGYPYATPETVRRVGVLKAKFLARWLGGLLLIAGSAWLVYDLVVR